MEVYDFSFHAMGSPCSLQFFAVNRQQAEHGFVQVTELIERLEQRYSRYRAESLVTRINMAAGSGVEVPIDSETYALLGYADQCHRESGGLFDITSGVLRRIWRFKEQVDLPLKSEINALLPLIGWKRVRWNESAIYLPDAGMELDFGGIVKEYAADAAAGLLRKHNICSGIVELGGDIRVVGPLPDGSGWPIAVRKQDQPPTNGIVEIRLKSGGVASSGDYERFLSIDGVRYGHILNPKTGWPVSGLTAVSVVADHCILAGSVATIAMLKGKAGKRWLQNSGLPFLCCQNNGQIFNCLQVVK